MMKPLGESFPEHAGESLTGARFSFSGAIEGLEDRVINHPTGKVRVVSYPSPHDEQRVLSERLQRAGLVLGRMFDEEEGRSYYRIPVSSRPIAYDAQSYAHGQFSYGDAQMMEGLGQLLARVERESEGLVIGGNLTKKIAFVEFTHPGERQLFVIPGVELDFTSPPPLTESQDYYASRLSDESGVQFAQFAAHFYAGYNAGE